MNAGGDYLLQPHSVQVVRGLGLLGNGADPVSRVLALDDPVEAQDILRDEERRRLHEIRQIVLAATNNVPIRVGDVVSPGRPGNPPKRRFRIRRDRRLRKPDWAKSA